MSDRITTETIRKAVKRLRESAKPTVDECYTVEAIDMQAAREAQDIIDRCDSLYTGNVNRLYGVQLQSPVEVHSTTKF